MMFFKFLLISFQMKIMMMCGFDPNKVSGGPRGRVGKVAVFQRS